MTSLNSRLATATYPVVGLTGGIAAGKTYAAIRLAASEWVVINADQVAREVVEPGTEGLAALVQAFGPGILSPAGTLDREKMAGLVFTDPARREHLEAILHPRIERRLAERLRELPAGIKGAVLDAALGVRLLPTIASLITTLLVFDLGQKIGTAGRSGLTAAQVVNEENERELANLIYEYGEERRSRRIARAIVRGRPVTTTGQLARIVASTAPPMKHEHIHPATRTFQALRIFVNRELDEIKALLEAAPRLIKPEGRLVVISFHSLEDRIAKDSLRDGAKKRIWEILTKKPVTASEEEIERNPRSRSAKLRAAEKK